MPAQNLCLDSVTGCVHEDSRLFQALAEVQTHAQVVDLQCFAELAVLSVGRSDCMRIAGAAVLLLHGSLS